MAGLTPDDYRRASGFRRSEAPRAAPRLPALQAYQTVDIASMEAPEWLRGRQSVAGVPVSDRSALRNSTFFRAMCLISGSIGMLPIHLIRRKADGTTERARDHPTFRALHRRPNSYMTPFEFKSYMQLVALLDGRACALVVRQAGQPREFIPLPRKAVTPKLGSDFKIRFEYRRPSGGTVVLEQEDVLHFRGPISLDGVTGLGLLDVATDTIGLAAVAQRAVGRLLTKGTIARGALEAPQTLGGEAIENLKASLREDYAGADADNDWLILEEGLKANLFASNAKDSQLVELMKREAEEVSRFTGAPRPLLMFDETSWGSGIEQLGLFFVTYCLMSWFVIWEEAIWRTLSPADQEPADGSMLYAKFNERALLRGSMKDQAEFMAKALGSGGGHAWSTQNEARDAFDLNPLPGGDDLPRPGTSAAAVLEDANAEA